MLDLAVKYESDLQAIFADLYLRDEYKYYWNYSYREKYKASESTWTRHEFVSRDKDGLIGYLGYSIDRETDAADGLAIINFKNDANIIFAKDLYQFLSEVFCKYKFNKLNYSVVVGNPIERSYDRLTKKYGGRIVGTKKREVKLIDNTLYDLKMYEILREEYMESLNEVRK
ncbi:hypothetical protein D3C87_891640 [compost metagenome]